MQIEANNGKSLLMFFFDRVYDTVFSSICGLRRWVLLPDAVVGALENALVDEVHKVGIVLVCCEHSYLIIGVICLVVCFLQGFHISVFNG